MHGNSFQVFMGRGETEVWKSKNSASVRCISNPTIKEIQGRKEKGSRTLEMYVTRKINPTGKKGGNNADCSSERQWCS